MEIKHIVIHCSDSPNSLSDGRLDTAETIHRWHRENGWDGIGYHEVIREDGVLEHGRPHYWPGAHCPAVNRCSLGICLIGDGNFNAVQLRALRILLAGLLSKYPHARLANHRDFDASKTCPGEGFDVVEWFAGEAL